MAARRLIIVLVLLLAASVIAAAIAPDRTGKLVGAGTDSSTTTTETTTELDPGVPETATGAVGEDLSLAIQASSKKPQTVTGFVGDQLALDVAADPPRLIAIRPLGLTDFAATDAPAHFDLLLQDPGTYPITDGDDPHDTVLGKLVIKEPPLPSEKGEGKGKSGSKGTKAGAGK